MYNTNRLEYFYNRVNSEINEEYESEENQLSTVDTAIIDINNFKIDIHNTARSNLDISSWEKEDTGSGKIINRIIKAIEFSKNNLLQHQPKWGLERRSHHSLYEILEDKEEIKTIEQLFYSFYKSQSIDDENFFNTLVKLCGKKYDFIAYLFFIKDNTRYCSLSPKHFDASFALLGISLTVSKKCSFENYFAFLKELDSIKEYLVQKLNRSTSITDAHSFLWLIHTMEDDYITKSDNVNNTLELNQNSSIEVEKIINKLIPEKQLQLIILYDLTKFWMYSKTNYPHKTYITLNKNYIRLNVGMVEAFVINDSGILFNTDKNITNPEFTGHYKNEQNAMPVELSHKVYSEQRDLYETAIFSIINKLAKKQKHPTAYKAHSIDLANYLENKFLELDFDIPEIQETDTSFIEGSIKTVTFNKYERNPNARKECLAYYQGYACQVCGIDFEKMYGFIGRNFIHVHHINPIANIGAEYIVNPIKDLIPVCPNCHSMLHVRKPNPYSIEELKAMLKLSLGNQSEI
jgi:hypothetical protein